MDVESLIEKWREFPSEEHRCLVVLDDVWEDNKGICRLVQRSFGSMMNGSRVLVTTRSSVIAKQVNTSTEPHQLGLLSDDESVELLLNKAFPHLQDVKTSCPKDLVDLAPQLAKKCGRLPLALTELGSILSGRETTPYVWKKMEEKMNWGSDGKEFQKVLALSYEVLDYDKKPCFLYLGLFPQDYEISASLLFKLWVAEGLVKDEDAGYEVLEELVQRSLVQIKKRRIDGRIKKCSVHDLLLELAKDDIKPKGFVARVCA
ncbi:hypothetical protein J5N97_005190 [Dioscorea zingiberensis]|uniref:NB-ARC domain-containing protein n=1 Tax=Dioscorea zingiberensis TaxID=325984 RepID=A0A9D5D8L3_9LILI|nr:hypothetical protein J5N97_005190 [Dioscorea zingiberensis]